jgi:hypothetical protein
VRVEGTVEYALPGAVLRVNGKEVAVADGKFTADVALEDGPAATLEAAYGAPGPAAPKAAKVTVSVDTKRPTLRVAPDPDAFERHAVDGIYRSLETSVTVEGRADDANLAEVVVAAAGVEHRPTLSRDARGAAFRQVLAGASGDASRPLEVVVRAKDAFGHEAAPVTLKFLHDPGKWHQIRFVRAMERGDVAEGDRLETVIREKYGLSVAPQYLAALEAHRRPPGVDVHGISFFQGDEGSPLRIALMAQGTPLEFTVTLSGMRATDELYVFNEQRPISAAERAGQVPVSIRVVDVDARLIRDEESAFGGGRLTVPIDVRDASRKPPTNRFSTGFYVMVWPAFLYQSMRNSIGTAEGGGLRPAPSALPPIGAGVDIAGLAGALLRRLGR